MACEAGYQPVEDSPVKEGFAQQALLQQYHLCLLMHQAQIRLHWCITASDLRHAAGHGLTSFREGGTIAHMRPHQVAA